ncbi:MAG: histidine--tRNA ligase [Acidimicrobiia bacterium]
MSFQPPKGTNDVLAPGSESWRRALQQWDEWSLRYGYPLVITPVFEATELFERGVGDTTELVTKQMYTFSDRGGRSVTLRPEGTAGVVRAYLDAGLQGPWKGAYSGPFFRYEQPQRGRSRQFWQVGVEYLAVEGPVADAEVIELGYRFLTDLGVPGLELLINSLGTPESRAEYVESLRGYLRGVEDHLSEESVRLIERNPLRVLDSKTDRALLTDPPRMFDFLSEADREHYEAVKAALDDLGIAHREDHRLVRGLDYYTRTTFEYVATDLEAAQNAVGGGGRYDGLAEALGGRRVPGVGFALGIDRILLSLGDPERGHLQAYLVSETGPEDALRVASRLRESGIRVDFDTERRSVKNQFRSAKRLEAPVVLVWKGDDHPLDAQTFDEREEIALDDVPLWVTEHT